MTLNLETVSCNYLCLISVRRLILWTLQPYTAGCTTYTVDTAAIYCRLYDEYCGQYSHILPVTRHILWTL